VGLVCSVLDAFDIEEVSLVGHSLGGMYGLWLGLDQPGRLGRLVGFGDFAVAFPGAKPKRSLRLLATPGLNRLALSAPAPARLFRASLGSAIGTAALRAVPPEVIDVAYVASRRPGYARSVSSLMERINRPWRPRPENVLTDDELGRIAQPVLFVWGKDDVFLSPEAAQRSVAKMPNARLEVIPGGHQPWYDSLDRATQLVLEFLATP
jgi:pimeloyl-ACP methyl ester carboxylesterase